MWLPALVRQDAAACGDYGRQKSMEHNGGQSPIIGVKPFLVQFKSERVPSK